jgi:hypothetical protein
MAATVHSLRLGSLNERSSFLVYARAGVISEGDAQSIAGVFGPAGLPVPHVARPVIEHRDPPKIALTLSGPAARAMLSFSYGPHVVPEYDLRTVYFQDAKRDQIHRYYRDTVAESSAAAQLEARSLTPFGYGGRSYTVRARVKEREAWIGFLANEVPQLRAAGWVVSIKKSFPYRLLKADGPWEIALTSSSTTSDHVNVSVIAHTEDDRNVSIVELVLEALKAKADVGHTGETILLGPTAKNEYIEIPMSRFRQIATMLYDLAASSGKTVSIPLSRAIPLVSTDIALTGNGASRLRALVKTLTDAAYVAPIPKRFNGTPRGYQHEALSWLERLAKANFGGILADDMGTGQDRRCPHAYSQRSTSAGSPLAESRRLSENGVAGVV